MLTLTALFAYIFYTVSSSFADFHELFGISKPICKENFLIAIHAYKSNSYYLSFMLLKEIDLHESARAYGNALDIFKENYVNSHWGDICISKHIQTR